MDGAQQALDINLYLNKDIKARDLGRVNRDEATMPVVNKQVSTKSRGGEVVDTASSVSDVAEDEAVGGSSEGSEDVGESKSVHEKTLRELDSDAFGVCGFDAPDAFVDLELVDGREKGDRRVEGCVVEDRVWDLVLYESLWRLLRFVGFVVPWIGKLHASPRGRNGSTRLV